MANQRGWTTRPIALSVAACWGVVACLAPPLAGCDSTKALSSKLSGKRAKTKKRESGTPTEKLTDLLAVMMFDEDPPSKKTTRFDGEKWMLGGDYVLGSYRSFDTIPEGVRPEKVELCWFPNERDTVGLIVNFSVGVETLGPEFADMKALNEGKAPTVLPLKVDVWGRPGHVVQLTNGPLEGVTVVYTKSLGEVTLISPKAMKKPSDVCLGKAVYELLKEKT